MAYHAVYLTMTVVLACLLMPSSNDAAHVRNIRRPRVDCTKHPFAPVCRGVAAKRNFIPATVSDDVISTADNFDTMVLRSVLSSFRNRDPRSSESQQSLLKHLLAQAQQQEQSYNVQDQRDEADLVLPKLLVRRNANSRNSF